MGLGVPGEGGRGSEDLPRNRARDYCPPTLINRAFFQEIRHPGFDIDRYFVMGARVGKSTYVRSKNVIGEP